MTNLEDLPKYIWPFTHLFNKKIFEKLQEWREWNHKINLTEKTPKELNTKAYIITIKEEEVLNQWLDEQLKAGLIVESKSRYAAPCFYISKKGSSLRLVQDYSKLNQVMIKDKTLLSLIREVIDKLKEVKYFNKLNFIWGYNNVWIKEGDEWKAAFLMNRVLRITSLRVDKWEEPCIGLTQENLIENSVQDCLPYILKVPGLC